MVLRRDDWLDLARKVDWTPRYVDERECSLKRSAAARG